MSLPIPLPFPIVIDVYYDIPNTFGWLAVDI
jgi:hypothetical protein